MLMTPIFLVKIRDMHVGLVQQNTDRILQSTAIG